MAYGVRRIAAVGEDMVEGFETGDGLVLAEGDEEIGEFVLGNGELFHGLCQRDENGMARVAVVAGIEFSLPLIEQGERCSRFSNFVAEVVGDAAIGVDVQEILTEFPGQKPGRHGKVFVMRAGELAAIFSRLLERWSGGRDSVCDGEAAPVRGRSGHRRYLRVGNRSHSY